MSTVVVLVERRKWHPVWRYFVIEDGSDTGWSMKTGESYARVQTGLRLTRRSAWHEAQHRADAVRRMQEWAASR